jgi:hypothetical protein
VKGSRANGVGLRLIQFFFTPCLTKKECLPSNAMKGWSGGIDEEDNSKFLATYRDVTGVRADGGDRAGG